MALGRFTICSPTLRFSRTVDSQMKLDLEEALLQKGNRKHNLAVNDIKGQFKISFILLGFRSIHVQHILAHGYQSVSSMQR